MAESTDDVAASEFGAATVVGGLTPPLLISKEPKGIPVRETPPAVRGVVGVGAEVVLVLPHGADVPGTVGVLPVTVVPTPVVVIVGGSPAVAPKGEVPNVDPVVIGAELVDDKSVAMPPPSKTDVDPGDTAVGAVSAQGDDMVLRPVVPTVLSSGLMPGVESSVAPKGIPVGATLPAVAPSGDVAPILGVVVIICANATLHPNSTEMVNASNARRMSYLFEQAGSRSARSNML